MSETTSLHSPETMLLITSAKEGSQEAWEDLYVRYKGYLRFQVEMRIPGFARRRFNADDVLQSAFLSAWRKIEGFRYQGEGSLMRWLTRIVHNDLYNRIRAIKAEQVRMNVESQVFSSQSFEPPDPKAELPEELATQAESERQVKYAYTRLAPEEQEVLALHFGQSVGWEEIGQILGLSRSGARKRFEKALERLQTLSKEPPPEEDEPGSAAADA